MNGRFTFVAHMVSEHSEKELTVTFSAWRLLKIVDDFTELRHGLARLEPNERRVRTEKWLVATGPAYAATQRVKRAFFVTSEMLQCAQTPELKTSS